MEKDIDFEKLRALVQDSKDLLEKLLETAAADWDVQLDLLSKAISANNPLEIQKRLHRINGSVRSFYAQGLAVQLTEYEKAIARGEVRDWTLVVEGLRSQLDRLKNAILQFVDREMN